MFEDEKSPRRAQVRRIGQSVRTLALETQHYVDAVARTLSLTRSDVSAIGEMMEAERTGEYLTPGEIGRRVHLSAAAVTALVDRLERVGHATRTRHVTDRRRVVVSPTPSAGEASRDLFTPLNEAHRAVLAQYSDAELALVERVMRELVEASRGSTARSGMRPPPVEQDAAPPSGELPPLP